MLKLKRLSLIGLIVALLGLLRLPKVRTEIILLYRRIFALIRKAFAFLFGFTTKHVQDHVEFTRLTEK